MYEMRWNALIFQKVQRKREIFPKIMYEMRWNALIFQKVRRKTLHNNSLKYSLEVKIGSSANWEKWTALVRIKNWYFYSFDDFNWNSSFLVTFGLRDRYWIVKVPHIFHNVVIVWQGNSSCTLFFSFSLRYLCQTIFYQFKIIGNFPWCWHFGAKMRLWTVQKHMNNPQKDPFRAYLTVLW